MRNYFFILFVFLATTASAENWVCYEPTTKEINRYAQGDCLAMELCSGKNNTGLQFNCLEASKEEFDKARQSNVKFDSSVVSGNRIIDLTVEEVEAKEKPKRDAETAEKAKVDSLRLKLRGLGLNVEEINLLLNSAVSE